MPILYHCSSLQGNAHHCCGNRTLRVSISRVAMPHISFSTVDCFLKLGLQKYITDKTLVYTLINYVFAYGYEWINILNKASMSLRSKLPAGDSPGYLKYQGKMVKWKLFIFSRLLLLDVCQHSLTPVNLLINLKHFQVL